MSGSSWSLPKGGALKAVVVYESHWGNTEAIARAIAEGMGDGTVVMHTDAAVPEAVAGADLLVAGAPLLGFSLPTDAMLEQIRTSPDPRQPTAETGHPSMRSWLASLSPRPGRCAGFETAIWWSPGSSAKAIQRGLVAAGRTSASKPRRFVVTGRFGPLKAGEVQRAREWGAQLAAGVGAAADRPGGS
jgi:hypothetical protein